MIITKSHPFTKDEIENLSEEFEVYIKTVIDINKRVCAAGMNRHFEGEQVLLKDGSKQGAPMTEKKMLVGSLSNDLLRIANLTYRGSNKAASRFLQEAKRWGEGILEQNTKSYIKNIAQEIIADTPESLNKEKAERYLMYSTLLQNYSLKIS